MQVDFLLLLGLNVRSLLPQIIRHNRVLPRVPILHRRLLALALHTLPGLVLTPNEHDTGQIILSISKWGFFKIAHFQDNIVHVGFDVLDDELHFFLFFFFEDLVVDLVVFCVQFEVDCLLQGEDFVLFGQV